MTSERERFVAKYLADISKLIAGAGVIVKAFSPESIEWSQLTLALICAVGIFIIAVRLHPKE